MIFQNFNNATVTGVPYCIGGAQAPSGITVSSNTSKELQMPFITAINNNYYAGNISGNVYISGTAGMDCSGFVCIVYDVWNSNAGRYSTHSLTSDNGPFKVSSAAPSYMDIYIKPGNHVMVVKGSIYYSSGHGVLPVYESARSAGRTIENNRDLNGLSGYSTGVLR